MQPDHSASNNSNFHGNGLQKDLKVPQPTSDTASETSEAYDPLGDRRKRRKVSVEPENHAPEQRQWNLLPPPRIVETRRQTLARNTLPGTAATKVDSPKKRRGRPPKSSTVKGDEENNIKDTQSKKVSESNQPKASFTQIPRRADSVREKSMRLTAKGTLLSSPKSSQESKLPQPAASPKLKVRKAPGSLTLKNGKLMHTLTVRLKYQNVDVTGKRIDEILSTQLSATSAAKPGTKIEKTQESSHKITHPFFLGKTAAQPPLQSSSAVDSEAKAQDSHDEESKKAVPWKDIAFKAKKPAFSKVLQKPAWPPHALQHVGRLSPEQRQSNNHAAARNKQKAKAVTNHIAQDENILARYTDSLLRDLSTTEGCTPCEKLQCTSREALNQLQVNEDILRQSLPVMYAKEKAATSSSPFDRCQAAGPLPWSQKYGPTSWQEVLQPDCQQLHDWLKGLAVHQVQSGSDKGTSKLPVKRRKKAKRRDEELSDFIVNDFEDQDESRIKNSILIVGPNGCGKTASVYAVARQLGFEVFEIHPGMRRSQKDIFDKVGDMAQNHLVQGGNALSRDASILPEIESTQEPQNSVQPSINTLFSKPATKLSKLSRSGPPQPAKEQKQSLILFEEVDHIFEEDRGFWSGVQALIQNSKRPVVLTCNTLHGIPHEDLDLFAILSYTPPPADVVGEYLCYIAAAEGHIIQPNVMRSLYSTKHYDLRATIMELDLWCQMTVGSDKGGLDWIPHYDSGVSKEVQRLRVMSKDTFSEGLDLLPSSHADLVEIISFLHHTSLVPFTRWIDYASTVCAQSNVASLPEIFELAADCSDVDLLDETTQALMAARVWPADQSELTDLRAFAQRCCTESAIDVETNTDALFDILQPLSSEKPVFPPSQGRLAPSLDEPRNSIATDLAPYVRAIATYDLGLEAYRHEMSSSQGKKTRTTRAARAAAEGGDKGFTRPERWLPADLDLRAVLATGGDWPRWLQDPANSQASSPFDPSHSNENTPDQVMSNDIFCPSSVDAASCG